MKNLNKTPAPCPDESIDEKQPNEAQVAGSPQTSRKRGLRSDAKKRAASRPEFGPSPGYHPVPGAYGDPTHYPAKTSANLINDLPPTADPMERVPADQVQDEPLERGPHDQEE